MPATLLNLFGSGAPRAGALVECFSRNTRTDLASCALLAIGRVWRGDLPLCLSAQGVQADDFFTHQGLPHADV